MKWCSCQQIRFLLSEEGAGQAGKGRLRKVMHGGEELARSRKSLGRMTSPRARDASMAATLVPGQPGGGGWGGEDNQRFLRTQMLLGEARRGLRALYFVNKH